MGSPPVERCLACEADAVGNQSGSSRRNWIKVATRLSSPKSWQFIARDARKTGPVSAAADMIGSRWTPVLVGENQSRHRTSDRPLRDGSSMAPFPDNKSPGYVHPGPSRRTDWLPTASASQARQRSTGWRPLSPFRRHADTPSTQSTAETPPHSRLAR